MRTLLPVLAIATALGLIATPARAVAEFPGEIRSHLGLDYMPPCSICHATASGGGPMAKPFGIAMQQRGLMAGDLGSLDRALDQMQTDKVDSNGNGVTDIQDLRNGVDPNDPGNLSLTGPTPQYGCRVAVPGRAPEHSWGLWWWFGLGILVATSRRRLGFPLRD
jgi:hypothetical protein